MSNLLYNAGWALLLVLMLALTLRCFVRRKPNSSEGITDAALENLAEPERRFLAHRRRVSEEEIRKQNQR